MDITSNNKEVEMNWEMVKLGDVCDVLGGYAFKSESFKNDGIPLLRISNITDGEISFKDDCVCVEDSKLESLQKFKVITGDILLALSGATTGKFGVYKLKRFSYLNQRVGLIRAKEKTDQQYLLYYLNIIKPQIEQIAQGAAQPNISTNEISNLQIPLPPLSVQKRIATILDAADALRRKDQELLKKYDELAQAIFIDMFGDPVRNEKGWEVKKLGDAVHFPSGLVDPKTKPYSSFYHVGGDNIERNTGRIFGLKRSNELSLKSGKFHFTKNHILYNKIRPNLNKVALPDFEGICSADMYPLLPNENLILKEYLYFIIRTDSYLDFAEKQARRANIPKINMKEMACFEFPIPPLEIQIKFVELFEVLKVNSVKINETSIKSDSLFQTLLQKAFKGEL
jgi:type I restriction enzyme, S subunit